MVKLFADDTKVYNTIYSVSDCEDLQQDLNSLGSWSNTWKLNFNADKCVVLKVREKEDYVYTLNGVQLKQVKQQKDLGILISDDLSPGVHIQNIINKANQRVGLVKRCFTGLDNKIEILYKTLIRPVLEYGANVWSPWHKKDQQALDSVQRRCLRLSSKEIKLDSLDKRRMFSDMCETYKFLHGLYKISPEKFFSHPNRNLRGHSLKLAKKYTRSDTFKYFFSNRVVDKWNDLPEYVVSAPSLTSFKKRLRSLPSWPEG